MTALTCMSCGDAPGAPLCAVCELQLSISDLSAAPSKSAESVTTASEVPLLAVVTSNSVVADRGAPARLGVSSLTSATPSSSQPVSRAEDGVADFSGPASRNFDLEVSNLDAACFGDASAKSFAEAAAFILQPQYIRLPLSASTRWAPSARAIDMNTFTFCAAVISEIAPALNSSDIPSTLR
jgi:hypothetical protein